MSSAKETFTYSHEEPHLNGRAEVFIAPVNAELLAIRLNLSTQEAEVIAAERIAKQADKMPNLIGEYVLLATGTSHGISQRTQIDALERHAEQLGIGPQAYAIYKTDNILPEGTLFGPHSTPAQLKVRDRNELYAAQPRHWREQLFSAHNNPFDHLIREKAGTPVLVSYGIDMLEQVDTCSGYDSLDYETVYWRPAQGRNIEEAVQVLYQPVV